MSQNASSDDETERKPIIIRNSVDLQRLKLEKLMKHPEKPVIIPEKPKERGVPTVPDFVRNVMGSSAGAGSGEFHVYRHLRRKEYARQKYMKAKGEREQLDQEYRQKLEENKRIAEERTAKKRAKRMKKKNKKKVKKSEPKAKSSSEESVDEEEETDDKLEESNEKTEENEESNKTTDKQENDTKIENIPDSKNEST